MNEIRSIINLTKKGVAGNLIAFFYGNVNLKFSVSVILLHIFFFKFVFPFQYKNILQYSSERTEFGDR